MKVDDRLRDERVELCITSLVGIFINQKQFYCSLNMQMLLTFKNKKQKKH